MVNVLVVLVKKHWQSLLVHCVVAVLCEQWAERHSHQMLTIRELLTIGPGLY